MLGSACAPTVRLSDRDSIIRLILPSSVQLRSEREAGVRRAASGVVLAADATGRRSWILTTRHFLEPNETQSLYVTVPGRKERVKVKVTALSSESDLALLEAEGVALSPVTLKETALTRPPTRAERRGPRRETTPCV